MMNPATVARASVSENYFQATIRMVDFRTDSKDDGWCVRTARFVKCDDEDALAVEQRYLSTMVHDSRDRRQNYGNGGVRGMPFAGVLSSHSPYIWHTGVFTFSFYKGTKQLVPAPKHKIYPERPTQISITHFLWLVKESKACGSEAATRLLNERISAGEINPLRNRGETERFISMKELEATPLYDKLFLDCDIERIRYQPVLCDIFTYDLDAQKAKSNREAIKQLSPSDLRDLHELASSKPWLLCFWRNSGACFASLEELGYSGLLRAIDAFHVQPVDPVMLAAVRFYEATVKAHREQYGDTLMELEVMRFAHLNRRRARNPRVPENARKILCSADTAKDGELLQDAIAFLLRHDAIVEAREGHVALLHDYQRAQSCLRMLQNLCLKSELPILRPGQYVPCIPRELDGEQREAALRILRGDPIVGITGGPGSGKTEDIVWTVSRFAKVLVVTAHGTMTKELRKRLAGQNGSDNDVGDGNDGDPLEVKYRPESAHTIDYIDCVSFFNDGLKWTSHFDLLVIDEASNMDLGHLHKILRSTSDSRAKLGPMGGGGTGVSQVVFVFDENQQRPIGEGEPVLSLMRNVPDCLVRLTTQHRVHRDSQAIHAAARTILSGYPEAVRYAVMNNVKEQRVLHSGESVVHIPLSAGNILDGEAPLLRTVVRRMITLSDGALWPERWQFVAFRNCDVDVLSHSIYRVLLTLGHLNATELKRVCRASSNSGAMTMPYDLYVGPGVKLLFKETFKRNEKYPEVRRGEVCVVRQISSDARLITLTDGRVICLDRSRHVDPQKVRYGYAMTSYSTQGAGYKACCVYLHPQHPAEEEWPRLDSYYTAFTRASELCVVVANRSDIDRVCARLPRQRSTVFDVVLENGDLPFLTTRRKKRQDVTRLRNVRSLKEAPLSYPCTLTQAMVCKGESYKWPGTVEKKKKKKRAAAISIYADVSSDDEDEKEEASDDDSILEPVALFSSLPTLPNSGAQLPRLRKRRKVAQEDRAK